MGKDIDDELNGTDTAATPAKKVKKAKAEAAAPAKGKAKKAEAAAPAKGKKATAEAKPAAKKAAAAPAKKAKKAAAEDATETSSEVKQAILKIKKAVSYADFAEKGGFNIRSVRRAARELRDAGHIEIEADGQTKVMKPAV